MAKVTRYLTTIHALRMLRKFLIGREIYFIPGSNSIWVPSRKEKWVNEAVCQPWPDIDGVVERLSPTEAARIELSRSFPSGKVGWRSPDIKLLDWRSPMYYGGVYSGEIRHIDIVSCYAQIYRKLWLDTCFPRGKGRLSLYPVYDKLVYWKAARNSVVGITIARKAVGIKGNTRVHLKTQNPFLSPHLWATIQAILHDLAEIALSLGAIYVMTDGYFFKDKAKAKLMRGVLDSLGIHYKRSGGYGEIRGWGAWSIKGIGSTKPYQMGQYSTKMFSNVSPYQKGDRYFVDWWAKLKGDH